MSLQNTIGNVEFIIYYNLIDWYPLPDMFRNKYYREISGIARELHFIKSYLDYNVKHTVQNVLVPQAS